MIVRSSHCFSETKLPILICNGPATSILFQPTQRLAVFISDIGLLTTVYTLYSLASYMGTGTLFRVYGVPWFAMSHWIMMVVFLQHTDPVLPHYRAAKWTYARGALATMDRDFLGWQGRYFLHNVSSDFCPRCHLEGALMCLSHYFPSQVSHCHIVHHFFPELPHCT